MPVVTNLKPAAREENRVNVFLDNLFAFSLDIAQVVEFHLKIGKTLTEKEVKDLEHASEFGKLYGRTLEWALARPRSIKETHDHLTQKLTRLKYDNKLREKNRERLKADPALKARQRDLKIKTTIRREYTNDDIEKVIARLIEKGYISDERFAKWYIENRNFKKGVSRRRLADELTKKGVARDLIAKLLESSDRNDSSEIKKFIKKKGPKSTPEKLLRSLVSHGFPYDLSRTLVEEYFSAPDFFDSSVD